LFRYSPPSYREETPERMPWKLDCTLPTAWVYRVRSPRVSRRAMACRATYRNVPLVTSVVRFPHRKPITERRVSRARCSR
jgi:hypothetical protein